MRIDSVICAPDPIPTRHIRTCNSEWWPSGGGSFRARDEMLLGTHRMHTGVYLFE